MIYGKLFAAIVLLFSIAFLTMAGFFFVQMVNQGSWIEAPVVAVQTGDDCHDPFHFVGYRGVGGRNDTLAYQVDGAQHTVTACLSQPTKTVLYNPSDPSVAAVDYGNMMWYDVGGCLLVGLAALYHSLFGAKPSRWIFGGGYRGLLR